MFNIPTVAAVVGSKPSCQSMGFAVGSMDVMLMAGMLAYPLPLIEIIIEKFHQYPE